MKQKNYNYSSHDQIGQVLPYYKIFSSSVLGAQYLGTAMDGEAKISIGIVGIVPLPYHKSVENIFLHHCSALWVVAGALYACLVWKNPDN